MDRHAFAPFLERLRAEAARLRQHGACEAAATKELVANELDAFIREKELTELTLDEASAESGYSAAHLGRLVNEGRLRNVGRRGAPRVLRADLPKKPGSSRLADGPDLVGDTLDGKRHSRAERG